MCLRGHRVWWADVASRCAAPSSTSRREVCMICEWCKIVIYNRFPSPAMRGFSHVSVTAF